MQDVRLAQHPQPKPFPPQRGKGFVRASGALATALLTATAAQAQTQLTFVGCPILRDTAAAPCWLAEYEGQMWFLGGPGVQPPSLGHQVLVEGTPTDQTRCGGKVLSDLRLSIRPERAPLCDVILPATAEHPDPGPAIEPPPPPPAEPPLDRKGSQRFEVHYDFDWQTAARDTAIIREAAAYALENPEAQIGVIGYRAAVALSDGRILDETESIAERRASDLLETLVTLGVDRDKIETRAETAPELGDHTARRAIIAVIMSGSTEPESDF